ncbi:TetR/AcrR family transcriptional regulator [Antrihabitans sp. YC2-6]|uniref:TetR/AcrR family transcriptional regulator n=1 Tax=Antrihabitans sp. YC2-6 TaxID=2799498 RepID=UPI0018F7448A|nr:TetR/AcrR family transcriptional regulator [Antrihabitans sp. YC2-6]MBJ8344940.1 TetR/AcrR family transcriptional regulator [Antrihabitans sp. YC2-6]
MPRLAERSRRVPLTRDDIVDAAIRVIDDGGPRPSMDAIAREAGIAKPRLYRLVADKADLYNEIANRMTQDAAKTAAPDFTLMMQPPRTAVRRLVAAYASTIREHPNVFRFLTQAQFGADSRESGLPLDVARDLAAKLTLRARPMLAGLAVDANGLDYLVRAVAGVFVSTADLWLGSDGTPDEDRTTEFVDQATEFVWQLIDGFLRRKNIVADPATSILTTIAAAGAGAVKK